MLNKLILELILLIIILNNIYVEASDIPKTPFVYRPSQSSQDTISSYSSGDGSSQSRMHSPSEATSLNITRKIVYPIREGGFFNEATEKITVLVEATCLKKEGLEDLEIWEIPGNGLEIENCSYPLRTSDIGQILDYEATDKSFLKYEDINQTTIKRKLKDTSDPLYIRIYSMLDNRTQMLLHNDTTRGEVLKEAFFRDLSIIITNPDDTKFNKTYFKGSKVTFKNETLIGNNYQGYNPKSEDYLALNDYRLFKRRLLDDAFWDKSYPGVRRISYYKAHEDFKILGSLNSIRVGKKEIGETPLEVGESIIFKYYLHPKKLGITDIRSIIRAKGFRHEETITLNIIEREPKFEIDYSVGTKELTLNTPMKFEYDIKYLGGDDTSRDFIVNVNAPQNCLVDNKQFNRNISIGKTEKIIVNATYSKTGNTLSPPTISIERFSKSFPEDIQVLTERDKEAKITYEANSEDYLFYARIFGFAAIIELFIVVFLEWKHKKLNDKFFKDHDELIKDNKEVMEAVGYLCHHYSKKP